MRSVSTEVIHFGPSPTTVGGIQSVLRTIRDHSIGADRTRVIATWDGTSQLRNASLVGAALAAIGRAPRDTIVHVHLSRRGAWLRDGPLVLAAAGRRLRTVVTIHGSDFPNFARARPKFVRCALAPASQLICLSDDAAGVVEAMFGPGKVSKLPNPVAIDWESPPADKTPPVVLFAGAIGLRKGVDVLVQAWREFLDRGVAGECRVVGPIDDYRPPALERFRVEGPVDPTDAHLLVRSARVVVLPSRAEQMPMILAEALAGGRPFVATPVGGTSLLAQNHGVLVPVGDSTGLCDAFERFVRDPQLALRAGRLGQQFCIETRSPAVIDAQLRQIYERLE
jgi:glycosyltransferase involved in cell wall biosynthesis